MKRVLRSGGLVALLFLLLGPAAADPGDCTETAKLVASDAVASQFHGVSVAIDGDTAIVGSGARALEGAAYVYVRNGAGWVQQAKLTASDGAVGDLFGNAVGIDGDTAIVGATDDSHAGGTKAGAVYVFVRSGTTWTQQAKLTASDSFLRSQHRLGNAVGIAGDTVIAGAKLDNEKASSAGAAYVFVRSGTTWSQQAKLTASDPANQDRLGISVAVEGDCAIVGASGDDDGGSEAGSVYVFERSGTAWSETDKLLASDAAPVRAFGNAVALSGSTAAIGSVFGVYAFVRTGTTWSQQAKLTVATGFIGSFVAIDGDTIVAGAPDADFSKGAVHEFGRSGTNWTEQARYIASDRDGDNGNLGVAVAISGGTGVAGAVFDDHDGLFDAGAAYVFDCTPSNEAPTADAGPDQAISAGATVDLDGTGSFDDNTATPDLDYAWAFVSKPAGSTAVLSDTDTDEPSFVADKAGTYEVQLIVTDEEGLASVPDTVCIASVNLPPASIRSWASARRPSSTARPATTPTAMRSPTSGRSSRRRPAAPRR